MTLTELKNHLDNSTLPDNQLIILQGDLNNFLIKQYVERWSTIKGIPIVYLESLSSIRASNWVGGTPTENIFLYRAKELTTADILVLETTTENVLAVFEKIGEGIPKELRDKVIILPTLQDWQIKDYIKVTCPGISDEQLEWLMNSCGKDMHKIVLELDKIRYFPEVVQKDFFEELRKTGNLGPYYTYTILDFVNGIQKKDTAIIGDILPKIPIVDVEPTGLITMLYNSLKKMIKVKFNPRPTEQNTGLTSKQIYAISKSAPEFTGERLIKAFKIVTEVENLLLRNQLSEDQIIDYLVIKLMNI